MKTEPPSGADDSDACLIRNAIEYRLLTTLVKHAGKVHQFLLKEDWRPSHVHDTPYLRVYMGQLRQKLEADSEQPRYLLTEAGVGCRLLDR